MHRAALVIAVLSLSACSPPQTRTEQAAAAPTANVPYRLDAPSAVMRLAPVLREISGLAWLPSGRLAAVQDERGTIYELDPATGAILRETPFHRAGDFEGVAWDGAAIWALESNGTLYRLVEGAPVERLETGLSARCDAEGLEWDGRRLLVVCKEDPGGGLRDVRAVYAVDPATGVRTLAFTLDRRVLDGPDGPFKPSAIAMHPITGEYYLVSSVQRRLVVVAPDGRLLHAVGLPRERLSQPEGLAFAPDGTLYVASEGHPSVILRYDPLLPASPP